MKEPRFIAMTICDLDTSPLDLDADKFEEEEITVLKI
jgi:hypothetical protein